MVIKKGDKIKVSYVGTLDDGTVFDDSDKHAAPLEFVVGSGQIIKGFDEAVIGMKKGDEKEIKLEPSEAYGEPDPKLIKKVPLDQLPKDKKLEKGMVMFVNLPNGMQVPLTIKNITKKEATLDMNHPLAGKTLNFKIKIVEIFK
jgi:peptidylprolyl isomerase